MIFEQAVVDDFGFESVEEFHRLVASVDITSPDKLTAFRNWQHNDGTKQGLLALMEKNKNAER